MKKLLSLLSALTLVGGGGVSVVACASSSTPPSASSIADKIKDKNIELRAGSNKSTANTITDNDIKNQLQKNNKLTNDELKDITIENVTLKDNEVANKVTAFIKVKDNRASVVLNVVINSTAAQISAKIKDPTSTIIAIPAGSNKSLSNAETQVAIRKSLQIQYKLSDYDTSVSTITFPDASTQQLTDNEQNNSVKLKITDDATKPTNVEINLTKLQIHSTAAQIKAKITNPTTTVIGIIAGSNPKLSNVATQNAIKKAIKNHYKSLSPSVVLSDYDINAITFPDASTTTLKTKEQDNAVKLLITDDSGTNATANLTLSKVHINSTANEIAAKFTGKENDLISIKAGSNTTVSNTTTKAELRTAIKTEYSLTDADMADITFANQYQTLKDNEQANAVKLNITDDASPTKGQATVILTNVEIHSTAAEIKAKLDAIGRLNVTFVNVDTSDTTLNQANIDLILRALKANYGLPELSTWDRTQLSITVAAGTTLTLDTRVTVALQIGDDAITNGSATTNLEVARFTAASGNKYNAFKIADKIGAAAVVGIYAGSNKDVTVTATRDSLRTALVTANAAATGLDRADVDKITFTGSPLTDNETNNTVTATITEGSGASQVTTTVALTKVQIHSTAAQISAKITSPSTTVISIPAGSNPSLANVTTTANLKKAIQTQYNLSPHDISAISFLDASKITLKDDEQDNTVKVQIRDDKPIPDDTTVTLAKVQIHRTASSINTLIKGISKQNVAISGAGGVTGSGDINTRIKTALKAAASGLSTWDLASIYIKDGVTINNTQYTPVTITIVDDSTLLSVITATINVESAS